MDRIQEIIGRAKYKMATNSDYNYKINLEANVNPLKNNLNKIISILSVEDVFNRERNNSTLYRLLGRLNIITDNSINKIDDEDNITPNEFDWDPLFDGSNLSSNIQASSPNNWILQVLYPHRMDKYSNVESLPAYRGVTIKNILETNPSGTKNQVMLETLQKNKLSEGDFCYVYSINSNSIYTGFHEVEFLGDNGQDLEHKVRLKTKYINTSNNNILKRVVNVSDDDINFVNTKNILTAISTDKSGTTTTNSNYTKITTGNLSPNFSAFTHDLREADYIDLRVNNGNFILNGLHRVEKIIDRYNFIIDLRISNNPGTILNNVNARFRRMDGVPSDYYIRKFKLLTDNNYEINKATNFGFSIYPKSISNKFGISNDTWLFTFLDDIDTNDLYSHREGQLTELYFATIKRSGKNTFDWSNITAHWDFQYSYADNGNKIETISFNNPNGVGTIEKKFKKIDDYFGDFVEYNRREMLEKTISKVIHRFAINTENTAERGYYLDPFQRMYIRKFSNILESTRVPNLTVGIPGDSERRPNGSVAWRDILEPGFIEEGGNGVDYPFLNGSSYIYINKYIYVRRQIPDKTLPSKITSINPTRIC
jgi:hypothetical protein